jgi:mannose-6-phosphate isomerase-like protein (cupin superfamily)
MISGEGFQSCKLGPDFVGAPDGSEIRVLHVLNGGGLSECTLRVSGVSSAIAHKTVEEIWFITHGAGQIWRMLDNMEEITDLEPGVSLTIPLGTHFQFRNTGDVPLRFVISTMPQWPGNEEAIQVEGMWAVSSRHQQ